jgi:hypothetical protein
MCLLLGFLLSFRRLLLSRPFSGARTLLARFLHVLLLISCGLPQYIIDFVLDFFVLLDPDLFLNLLFLLLLYLGIIR